MIPSKSLARTGARSFWPGQLAVYKVTVQTRAG